MFLVKQIHVFNKGKECLICNANETFIFSPSNKHRVMKLQLANVEL